MFFFTLAFLCGDLWLQTFSHLPSSWRVECGVFACFLFFWMCKKHWSYAYLLLAFALGFAYSYTFASHILDWELPKNIEGKPIKIEGTIASLPEQKLAQTSFYFAMHDPKTLIRLTWKNPEKRLKAGGSWTLNVRLKRIHGLQNPGGFDYEAWSLQKGLRALGYVIASPENHLTSHAWYRYPLTHFREIMREKLLAILPSSPSAHWILALTIGERTDISKDEWQVLRNTGTNHLMAIAGLHIGLLIAMLYLLWRAIFNRQHKNIFLCLSFFAAFSYAALSGFSLPAQRAIIMLGIFTLTSFSKRIVNPWHAWGLALFIVLLLNPLTVLDQSLWLSFGTIALIIYGMSGRLFPQGWWWHWGRVQYVIGVGLIPISLMLFQQCSFISFAANSIAIPWLGFLVLPLCLVSLLFLPFLPSVSHVLLIIADKSLALLWLVLTYFSKVPTATWYQSIPSMKVLIITVIGFLIILMPRGLPGRMLGFILLLPLILFAPIRPRDGEYHLTLLDVGQGLSAVIETKNHVLVFDTGPRFNADVDMGESVVLPFLRTRNIKTIDMMVVSHGDNDHIGGSGALINALSVRTIKTTVPDKIPSSDYCLAGTHWQWDGVQFAFIYPTPENLNLGNDSSCVLKVDNGKHSVLLTGDIEKYAETQLVATSQGILHADVIVAPHHGSKTSGLKAFIQAVHPQIVLYPLGYRNRYRFPAASVVRAYASLDVLQRRTDELGAIEVMMTNNDEPILLQEYRKQQRRYWY